MQAVSSILVLLFFVFIGVYIHALIKPKHKIYVKRFGENVNRRHLSKRFLPLLLAIFILIGITAPPSSADQQSSSQSQQTSSSQSKPQAPQPVTKEVTETSVVPFTTQTQNDSSLAQGQTSIAQQGVNGQKTTVYEVTYVNGQETSRTTKSDTVTTQPITQIVNNGTYVAPAPAPAPTPQPQAATPAPSPASPSPSGDGYTNVDGNYINSPSSNPAGATALCNDGTYSYSQHHSGTCSYHGGVAQWL